jgi:VIT1/CCC1 family predicted Fe2+/Mn2+ transporter
VPGAVSSAPRDGFVGGQTMLWTIIGVLVLLWLLCFVTHVGGALIHLILVVAVVVFIVNLLTGRRAL